MGVNSLPKTVTRQHRGCDLNPGLTAPEPSTLTTRLPSHLSVRSINCRLGDVYEAFQAEKGHLPVDPRQGRHRGNILVIETHVAWSI